MHNKESFKDLEAGSYSIILTPVEEEATFDVAEEVTRDTTILQTWTEVGKGKITRPTTIEKDKWRYHYFHFSPCELLIKVEGKDYKNKQEPLKGVTVKVTEGDPLKGKTADTDKDGVADFGIVPCGSKFKLSLKLKKEHDRIYTAKPAYGEAPGQQLNKPPYLITLELRRIYLQLLYKDPAGNVHPFPKDFPVLVEFSDSGSEKAYAKVDDDKGNLDFKICPDKKKFTIKAADDVVRYFVQKPKGSSWAPDDTPCVNNPSDEDLRKLTLAGKRFFAIPKTWSLAVCEWEKDGLSVAKNGLADVPSSGQCTKDSPGKLTLVPKNQYVRFVYYDRRYYHSNHGDKRVGIPQIVLKGARKVDASGAPTGPVAGTHDAVSNWVVDESDITKICQIVPWIVVKKPSGDPLDELDNKMLLEFGWPKGYVFAEDPSAVAKRKIVELAGNDAKLAIGVERPRYYDLPELWKSVNYYTRFVDTTKNKFFDDLASGDITPSYGKAAPLIFSLDDIVLVAGGSQAVKDKDASDAAKDLSADSRVAMLFLDPDKKFKMKVFDPDPKITGSDGIDYGYHSKTGFTKDKAGKYRNVIVEHPPWIRAVMFCSGFHDVYNKRAKNPTFADKHLLGARAAVLNDTDITHHEAVAATNSWGDYTAETCGNFVFYGMGYANVDIANNRVLLALVTYWNCRLKTNAHTAAGDVANARNKGMPNSMERWNVKDYEIHYTNRTDILGKTFCLFEAKRDNFDGKHLCMATVVRDNGDGGSWMSKDTAQLRESCYKTEPARLRVSDADYDGVVYSCLATAHEIGHATGLHDEYVYDLDNYSGLSRYKQYYDGMPYVTDDWALMKNNEALRLRYYWGKAAWLNKNLASVPGLKAEDKDKMELFFPAKNEHYSRPAGETLKNIYTPRYKQDKAPWTAGGSANMYLYWIGDDEFMHKLAGEPYKSILAISTKLSARFSAGNLAPWATGTNYKKKDMVTESGKKWFCKSDHTAGATFAGDAARWQEITDKGNWAKATAYDQADMVKDGGSYWCCDIAHTSADFATDAAQWWNVVDKGAWATGTNYAVFNIVTSGGEKYVCSAVHTATTFAADSANWVKVLDKGAWLPSTPYSKLDLVTNGVNTHLCQNDHTSAGRKTHNANWINAAPGQSWTDAQKQQWLGDLNKDLLAAMRGKFRLAGAGNDFSKSFITVFPQYEVVGTGTAASAGTNYELEIKRNGADDFNGVGNTLRVGENCNSNKIIRHFYGKCDGGTAALVKADLAEVATWVGGKAGGTVTVENT